MRHHVWFHSDSYPVALLLKGTAFDRTQIMLNYIDRLKTHGLGEHEVVAFTLDYAGKKKPTVSDMKAYLDVLMPELKDVRAKYLYCADSGYFKVLTGTKKAELNTGYVLPCSIKGYENMFVVFGMNYQQLMYNPALQPTLDAGLDALANHAKGQYKAPGDGIIHQAIYPEGLDAIKEALDSLLEYPELSADIEGFSLRFDQAGVATIAFAPDEHNFVAFPCDYQPCDPYQLDGKGPIMHGRYVPNPAVRALIKDFFVRYTGKVTWHNIAYDAKVLIYTLWMKDYFDTEGLLEGLEVMTKHFDDTKLIAYLATNTTAGNVLGLKFLAQEFAGNWAVEDIKDIRQTPLDDLLQYNGVDCLSTNYVLKKWYPVLVADKQKEIYETLFKPSAKTILQMELVGMPMSKKRIAEVKKELEDFSVAAEKRMRSNPIVTKMDYEVAFKAMTDKNKTLKVKQHPIDKFLNDPACKFNPGSPLQLQKLLYELMGLPVIDYTDTKQPATGADTLKKLINHCKTQDEKDLLNALLDHASVAILLSTFIPAFERGIVKDDSDIIWLHGCFNLGGTVSGRMSSSDPNMQNIPAGSRWAKLIKTIFMAPPGWLFVGADYSSLEDRISALTTKDPMKLKVYTDGYDGHCLRAYYYFGSQMEGIDPNSVLSINSIADKYKALRGDSKAPTFALTYQGTWRTLVTNLGWTEEKSKGVEKNYHDLYTVSDQYIQDRLIQASKDGYVEVAFGLRIRTPLLKQVVFGSASMPFEAAAEGRTAGNAMGQSYCMLNNRSSNAFIAQVWVSKHRLDILPCAQIHDANYLLVRDNIEPLLWANKHLTDEMKWQELPEIMHPEVKLGGELDIFWPTWANSITLPNDATGDEIVQMCAQGKYDYLNPKEKKK